MKYSIPHNLGRVSLGSSFIAVMLIGAILILISGMFAQSHTYPEAAHFFKIVFITMTAIATWYSVRGPLPRDGLLVTVAFMGIWGAAIGLPKHGFNSYTLSHMYAAIMPFLALSFGHYLGRLIMSGKRLYTLHFLKLCTIATGLTIGVYYTLYKMGYITYFGIDSPVHLLAPLLLAEGATLWFFGCAALALLTGKRSILLILLLQAIIYTLLIKRTSQKPTHKLARIMTSKVAMFVGVTAIISIASKFKLLGRFKTILSFNFSNRHDLYIATGGRCLELEWLYKHLNSSPLKWLTGGGWGESFDLPIGLNALEMFTRHYSHFSPGYIVLVYGLPFAIFLYCYLFNTFFRALPQATNPFVLIFISLFVLSFAGSLLFVNVQFWIFLGIARSYIKHNKKPLNHVTDCHSFYSSQNVSDDNYA